MTNVIKLTKNDGNPIQEELDNLAATLNASGMEMNYYFSALENIAMKHHNTSVRIEAKKYLFKKQDLQDDLEFMNNCIFFLRRQLKKTAISNLTPAQIIERKVGLSEDINVFVEINRNIQLACLRFTNEYFHVLFGQTNIAA